MVEKKSNPVIFGTISVIFRTNQVMFRKNTVIFMTNTVIFRTTWVRTLHRGAILSHFEPFEAI